MPLVLIVGNCCTGKTTFANQLVDFLKEKGLVNIELVNEEQLKITKREGYASSFAEKSTRSELKSATIHKLNGDCCVIMDSLNYIKGFRYELYCSARTFRTPYCVVWIECNESQSISWNLSRLELTGDGYDAEIMRDLRRRFEAPNDNNRWDNPLFMVSTISTAPVQSDEITTAAALGENSNLQQSTGKVRVSKSSWKPKGSTSGQSLNVSNTTHAETVTSSNSIATDSVKSVFFSGTAAATNHDIAKNFQTADEVLPRIYAYLMEADTPTPTSSTLVTQHGEADLLYELDRISQRVVQQLVSHQTENVEGTPIKFLEFDRELTMHRHVGLSELQRFRLQYVKINGQHPPESMKAVGSSFIDFLALQL